MGPTKVFSSMTIIISSTAMFRLCENSPMLSPSPSQAQFGVLSPGRSHNDDDDDGGGGGGDSGGYGGGGDDDDDDGDGDGDGGGRR